MTGLAVVLAAWTVVGGLVALWLADAVWRTEARPGRGPDATTCACCRHDRITHGTGPSAGPCSQCPCPEFRPPGGR